jgi:hypothetical protein
MRVPDAGRDGFRSRYRRRHRAQLQLGLAYCTRCAVRGIGIGVLIYKPLAGHSHDLGPGIEGVRYLGERGQRHVEIVWNDGRRGVVGVETEWAFDNKSGLPKGKLKLHAEPNGLKLEMKEADWVIISGNSAYVQGMAMDYQGNKYTIRLMMSNELRRETVSLLIWKGTDTNANTDYATYGQELIGHVE